MTLTADVRLRGLGRVPSSGATPGSRVVVLLASLTCATTALLVVVLLGPAGDAELFAAAATTLLGPGALDVFADPALQVGPLHLLLQVPAVLLATATGLSPAAVASVWTGAVVGALAAGALDPGARLPRERGLALAVAVAVTGPLSVAVLDGHVEDLLVLLVLLRASRAVASGSPLAAGLLVGAAGGLKLWGLLGMALLLGLPRARGLLRAATVAGAVVLCCYGPFLAAGRVATFDWVWRTGVEGPMALLLPPGTPFGWGARLLQGAVVLLVVGALGRRAGYDPVRAVLLLVTVRLLSEPNVLSYYWTPLAVVVLVLVWERTPSVPWCLRGSVLSSLLLGAAVLLAGPAGPWFRAALLLALLAVGTVGWRSVAAAGGGQR